MLPRTTSAPPQLCGNILALGPLAPDTLASGPWPQVPGPGLLASGFELLLLGLWPLASGLWLLAPSSLPLAFGLCSFSLAPRPGLLPTPLCAGQSPLTQPRSQVHPEFALVSGM